MYLKPFQNDWSLAWENIMESDIQEIATHIGFMLDNFASRLVEKLPATLTRENAHLFLRAFEDIETLT